MKLLLDSCISGQSAHALRDLGHDVSWAGELHPDPGDEQILKTAVAESRVLITIDKDFGELVMAQGLYRIGLIRLVGFRAKEQAAAISRLVSTYESDLLSGVILTAEPWRVRVRRLEPDP